tara:strand:+ start:36 stop:965 length:930 start_codon:yes stop_codon:yes gene_type:complete
MHVLGKVLAWFIVLGAGAAIVLSARTHQVRSSWHKALSDHREAYESKTDEFRIARFAHQAAIVDRDNAKRGWGSMWDPVDVRVVNAQNGFLQTSDAQTAGIAALAATGNQQQPMMMHGFLKIADGPDRFVGTFIQEGPAQGGMRTWKPTWQLRRGDQVDTWGSGQWRIRTTIPAHQKTRFVNLEVLLTQGDQTVADKGLDANIKGNVDLKADDQLRLRIAELMGENPDLAGLKGKLPDHMVDGLVRAIAAAEEQRNLGIETVDQLRRSLKDNHDRANLLLQQNRTLERSLPGATVAAPAVTGVIETAPR